MDQFSHKTTFAQVKDGERFLFEGSLRKWKRVGSGASSPGAGGTLTKVDAVRVVYTQSQSNPLHPVAAPFQYGKGALHVVTPEEKEVRLKAIQVARENLTGLGELLTLDGLIATGGGFDGVFRVIRGRMLKAEEAMRAWEQSFETRIAVVKEAGK